MICLLIDSGAQTSVTERKHAGSYFNPTGIDSEASLIQMALRAKNQDIIPFLIEKGANIDTANTWGFSPLMVAVYEKDVDMVKQLLTFHPNLNIRSKLKIDIVESYFGLRYGGKTVDTIPSGSTALSLAKKFKQQTIVELLQAAGATN